MRLHYRLEEISSIILGVLFVPTYDIQLYQGLPEVQSSNFSKISVFIGSINETVA